jgi:hypothetical protein
MSSLNTTTNWSNIGMKMEFMRYIKCVGTFINPNDMTRYSYKPYLVVKAVFGMNLNLVIAGADINLGEHLSSG